MDEQVLRKKWDVIILGAGAAGLMCAIEAAKAGCSVAILEKNERIGQKILISGGGRCNFTNIGASAANYISETPDFCKSALARYTPQDFIQLVELYGVPYHEKKLGQLFCSDSSKRITHLLEEECKRHGVQILLNCEVLRVEKHHEFCVESLKGKFYARSLVVATGGLSFPKLGVSDVGYRIARHFGHKIVPISPALVPLTLSNKERVWAQSLSGVSTPAKVGVSGISISFHENILWTHRGLSGPAILQISSYWRENEPIRIDLLPEISQAELLNQLTSKRVQSMHLHAFLSEKMPRSLAQSWCACGAHSKLLQRYSKPELERVAHLLKHFEMIPSGTEGYDKAEVTRGGVNAREISSKTMESRLASGLYFIGEVVDVTGQLGGYNFQWGWSSGAAAGRALGAYHAIHSK